MRRDEFNRVVEEYGSRIYGYLLRFLLHKEDAEDLTQSVFLSFYRQMENVDSEKYASYLFRAAHNQAVNYKKKKHRYVSLDKVHEDSLSEPQADESQDKEKERILRALNKLKPKEKLVLELQYYQKKSYKEIAVLTGFSVQAVDSLLVRAKRKLRKYLQD